MARLKKLSPPDQWPELYTAHDGMWNDLIRTGRLILPIVFGVFIAIMFSLYYVDIASRKNPGSSDLFWIVLPVIIDFLWIFLPVILVLIVYAWVSHVALDFFNAFYKPPEDTNSSSLIALRLRGVLPLPKLLVALTKTQYPFVIINIKDVTTEKFKLTEQPVFWLGGPALLVVMDGAGLYLQRGQEFSRTLGPGVHFLERFETVQDIVDLRPQTLRSGVIQGRSKDGIKIKFNVEVTFHILRAEIKRKKDEDPAQQPHKKTPAEREAEKLYLVGTIVDSGDLSAIRKVVERTTVRRIPAKGSDERKHVPAQWRDGVWGYISGDLAKYVTRHYLDELLIFEDVVENVRISDSTNSEPARVNQPAPLTPAGQLLSGQERERLRIEFDTSLRDRFGVTLTGLRIVEFDIPQEVYEQRLLLLDAERTSHIKRIEGHSIAENILTREKARTQGQQDLITSFADNMEGIDPAVFADSVLLSLSGILSQSKDDPMVSANMAKDTFETLKQLRDFLNRKEQTNDKNLPAK